MINDHSKTKSCALVVDLEYPQSLHSDYPLAPESVTVNETRKLIPNLRNKEKYIRTLP